jgi:hypothetical protein
VFPRLRLVDGVSGILVRIRRLVERWDGVFSVRGGEGVVCVLLTTLSTTGARGLSTTLIVVVRGFNKLLSPGPCICVGSVSPLFTHGRTVYCRCSCNVSGAEISSTPRQRSRRLMQDLHLQVAGPAPP